MPITLFNSIASWLLRKRYHQIELFLKYPLDVQDEVLHQLLDFSKDTMVGKQYGFQDSPKYDEFRNRVPIVTYEDIAPLIERTRRGEQNLFWPTAINGLQRAVERPMPRANLSRSVRKLWRIATINPARTCCASI